MEDNKIFYVYIWYDPRKNEPFYVGKGKGKRAYEVNDYNRNEFFLKKYRKIISDGLYTLR